MIVCEWNVNECERMNACFRQIGFWDSRGPHNYPQRFTKREHFVAFMTNILGEMGEKKRHGEAERLEKQLKEAESQETHSDDDGENDDDDGDGKSRHRKHGHARLHEEKLARSQEMYVMRKRGSQQPEVDAANVS